MFEIPTCLQYPSTSSISHSSLRTSNPQYGRALRKFYKVQSAVYSLNWYLTVGKENRTRKEWCFCFYNICQTANWASIPGKGLKKSSVRASVISGKPDQITCLTVMIPETHRYCLSDVSASEWGAVKPAPTSHHQARWLAVGCWSPPEQDFFCTDWGRSLDLSWAGEDTSEWMTQHTLLSLPFFIDRAVEGGPAAPQQLHLIRPCSWRRGLSSACQGHLFRASFQTFFHLFHENTEGMLKGFDSKLRTQKIHWVTGTLPRIQISLWVWIPGWNPSWCSATTKVADCFVSWRAIMTIEGKRERLYKSRTRVYRKSRDAPSIPALTQ